MTEALTLYKLIVLYTLDKARMPMTNAQICDLMLDKEYTTYFRVQEVLSEMEEAHLIHPEKIRNMTQYTITAEGENTIDFFSHQISAQIRQPEAARHFASSVFGFTFRISMDFP